jgi:AraC family transcriptional regulator, regulatory protein of adaptative response / DNA-3-methyladenine glycosylase II
MAARCPPLGTAETAQTRPSIRLLVLAVSDGACLHLDRTPGGVARQIRPSESRFGYMQDACPDVSGTHAGHEHIIKSMTRFTAVSTTGIYCRPGCLARTPKPGNARSYPIAAAAEAVGYRACFRCRPYREAPVLAAGSPDLVCRAVRQILAGALDGHTEQELAAGLGVSARHLRRLFSEHLGCTPTELARSSRVHFARRLLDDTDLPVSELAFACGYGSVRQLSRDCLAIFRDTPIALRARRRMKDRLVADGGLLLRLP